MTNSLSYKYGLVLGLAANFPSISLAYGLSPNYPRTSADFFSSSALVKPSFNNALDGSTFKPD